VAADQEEGREGDGQDIVDWTGLDIKTAAKLTEDRQITDGIIIITYLLYGAAQPEQSSALQSVPN